MRITRAIALGAVASLALPAMAIAHVTVTPTEAPGDDYALLQFTVPHGCEESPTTRIRVQVPENVPTATPQTNPFWELETKQGPKEEVELFGETITEGVREVIWTRNEPLPAHYLDTLGLQVRLPAGEEETIYFPVVQECEQGETRWIQEPGPGETSEDLEEPAPAVTLTAASAGGHGDTAPTGEAEATDDDDDDGAPMGLAIAGVVLGGLGLAAGGASLIRSRRD